MAPHILNLGATWKWMINTTSRLLKATVTTAHKAKWTPKPVRTGMKKRKSLAASGVPSPDRTPPTDYAIPNPKCVQGIYRRIQVFVGET